MVANSFEVVILNKHPKFAKSFIESIDKHHTEKPNITVVADNHTELFGDNSRIRTLTVCSKFVYSKNANIGINANPEKDIVLCNDDLTCTEDDFFYKLRDAAYRHAKCGLISPLIDGGVGNFMQMASNAHINWQNKPEEVCIIGTKCFSLPVCFPCVYIKRSTINEVGLLDETFVGYGCDDNDYCIRTRRADLWTMITRSVVIRHGIGGHGLNRGLNWSCSFATEGEIEGNEKRLQEKYKD